MQKTPFLIIILFISIPLIFSCKETEIEITKKTELDENLKIDPLFNFNGTVATWFQFKKAAYSVTLDDGTLDQYIVAWPKLEELGIKGTFFLAASLVDKGLWDDHGTTREMMNWSQAQEIAASGHEIGSHSFNHLDLSKEDIDYNKELQGSRNYIEEKLRDVKVETFCWPHWRETPKVMEIAADYYISARSGNGIISYYLNRKGGIPGETPDNMYRINALGFTNSQKETDWKNLIEQAYLQKGWFVTSYHGFKNETIKERALGWNPINVETFEESLQYIRNKKFWIATFGDVSKYIYERNRGELHIKNKTFSIEITLDDKLDDTIYDHPLSVSFKKPEKWQTIEVLNETKEKVVFTEKQGIIYINILPDGKSIEIKPLLTAGK